MCLILILWSSLLYLVHAQIPSTNLPPSKFKPFLALPTLQNLLLPLSISQGFVNEHLTVLNANLNLNPSASATPTNVSQTVTKRHLAPTGDVTTTQVSYSRLGSILAAYNETYYTHRLWFSVQNANANATAAGSFTDARCTAVAGTQVTWDCQSTIQTAAVSTSAGRVSTTGTDIAQTTFAKQKLAAGDHLYDVVALYPLVPTASRSGK